MFGCRLRVASAFLLRWIVGPAFVGSVDLTEPAVGRVGGLLSRATGTGDAKPPKASGSTNAFPVPPVLACQKVQKKVCGVRWGEGFLF